jgi:hypothetical protein
MRKSVHNRGVRALFASQSNKGACQPLQTVDQPRIVPELLTFVEDCHDRQPAFANRCPFFGSERPFETLVQRLQGPSFREKI